MAIYTQSQFRAMVDDRESQIEKLKKELAEAKASTSTPSASTATSTASARTSTAPAKPSAPSPGMTATDYAPTLEMSRAEFAQLPADAKSKFSKDGGKIVS